MRKTASCLFPLAIALCLCACEPFSAPAAKPSPSAPPAAPIWSEEAYVKTANSDANDQFGNSLAMEGDTLVVGAPYESSSQTTVTNGATASADNSGPNSGAAYVYRRNGAAWAQEAYLKASNRGDGDDFGWLVAVSGDTIAIAAKGESSGQTSITNGTGASSDDSRSASGAVYVYARAGASWTQQAYIKAANCDANDFFGGSLALNGDTLVVGAPREGSGQASITNGAGASSDNSKPGSGAVYVYKRTGGLWAQEAYIKAANGDPGDAFGSSLAVSGDALVVGAPNEDSSQSTIANGAAASSDNSRSDSGAAYVYRRTAGTWAQEAYLKAANNDAGDCFGIALSMDGDTVAISSSYESSAQAAVTNGEGASADNSHAESGAVYVYRRTAGTWAQEAYVKASNNDAGDQFGGSVALRGDRLVAGAIPEASSQASVTNGSGASPDNSSPLSGAAYVFERSGSSWSQVAYLKAANSGGWDMFSEALALGSDSVAVGAPGEGSAQDAITNGPGAASDNAKGFSGAAYLYRFK